MNNFIGNSSWAQSIRQSIRQVAAYRSSVLILGPSGTGKELIAESIHRHSPRADGPFVALDCTSVPPSLFASQLFGHVKGAFTGADCDTLGLFRSADGGTVLLDEIGELSQELQAQLLRVIQERAVTPVGSHKSVPVDLRILAATNRDLGAEVESGQFRLDLYYRLNVVKLRTMPLASRPEDIPLLCQHILDKLTIENGMPTRRLSPLAVRELMAHDWPGNVRELQNVLERLVVFSHGEEIGREHVIQLFMAETPEENQPWVTDIVADPLQPGPGNVPAQADDDLAAWPTMEDNERQLIQATLERVMYNQSAAAELLGIDRRQLARKVLKHNIEIPPRYRRTSPRNRIFNNEQGW